MQLRPSTPSLVVGLCLLVLGVGCGGGDGTGGPDASGADANGDTLDASAGGGDGSAGADADGTGNGGECQAAECDDGVACTVGSCTDEGQCAFEPDDALCADDNECTINTCDVEQGCLSENADDGADCAGGLGSCQGGVCQGEEAAIAGFRSTTLELQHPHVIIDTVIETAFGNIEICHDVTFDELNLLIATIDGLNPTLAQMIADLELNLINELDPFDQQDAHAGQSTLFGAECESETSCTFGLDDALGTAAFTVQRAGTCLADHPGIFDGAWPDGRTSVINEPEAGDHGCFATAPTDVNIEVEIAGEPVVLPLLDAQLSARFGGDPAATLEDGIVIGFLTQEAADEIDLEVDGLTLNLGRDLLPDNGASPGCEARTHCEGPDARVVHEDQCGWWFAFNFRGQRIAGTSGD
jgi:hypothetical protein